MNATTHWRKLVKKGIAVILVDQNSDAAKNFCSSTLILETGDQLWLGSLQKLCPKSQLFNVKQSLVK